MTRDAWRSAHEAWQRVTARRWYGSPRTPLDTLEDIGVVRRMLDQAELDAVRAARRARSSWAEIATRLGVTRQSAWERWRDVDDEAGSDPAAVDPAVDTVVADPVVVDPRLVTVPDVAGMSWPLASHRLDEEQLVAVRADSDQTFLGPEAADFIVLDQKPAAGMEVVPHTDVVLWLRRGPGSAGERAPLPVTPPPTGSRGALDETTGESVR